MTRLWRWLCCRTGHHRETVEVCIEGRESVNVPGYVWYQTLIGLRCLDCDMSRTLCSGERRTPSRRYALRGKA